MDTDFLRGLLVALLVLPAAAAGVVALMGQQRAAAVRWVSLLTTLICLLFAGIVATSFANQRMAEGNKTIPTSFRPDFVPGAGADPKHAHETTWNMLALGSGSVQFYIGID